MNYETARAKAEQMDGISCIVVDEDGGWTPMTWHDFLMSDISSTQVGWVSANTSKGNELSFKLAMRWLKVAQE